MAVALLAALCALSSSAGAPLRAADQDHPKPQATPTPAPKASPTPRSAPPPKAPVRAKAPGPAASGAKPEAPAGTEPSLSFTDFDLEKFHRPAPSADEAAEEEESPGTPATTGTAAGTPSGAAVGKPDSKAPPAKKRPRATPEISTEDPLRAFKDRDANEKFRKMQIETGRERIAKLQARLDYLTAKRDALQNPAPLLPGQTRGPATPPTPVSGPGKVAIGGFFPAIPPPQTDEDKENDKHLKVKDLLDQVNKEIASVQEDLDTAKAELASVETRFAQESPSR